MSCTKYRTGDLSSGLAYFSQVIKPSKYFQMHKEGDRCTLRISEAFPEDEGVYKCIAKNPAGEVTTSANLRVLGTLS